MPIQNEQARGSAMFADLRLAPGFVALASGVTPLTARGSVDDEVADILVMCSCIERSVSLLSPAQTALLAGDAGCLFAGFDARHEPAHYGAARDLIARSGFFDEFQARALGSALPMLDRYRRLLGRFDLERQVAGFAGDISFDRIRRLLSVH